MTVSTLRPNGTVSNTGTLGGGAGSAHAATNDNSDATYVQLDVNGERFVCGLDDLTLPTGAVIKSATARLRLRRTGLYTAVVQVIDQNGNGRWIDVNWTAATTVSWPAIAQAGITDASIDAFNLDVLLVSGAQPPPEFSAVLLVHEAYYDVVYVAKPIASADAPTGTITDTNLPTVEWTRTLDGDGGAQTHYEVKVYTDAQYGGGGFDPDTTTPTLTSGIAAGASLAWEATTPLPDDTYRAYVRVAQTVNGVAHWSDWDFVGFSIDVALPADPTFTATADSANGRIVLAFADNAGDATTDGFELQRSLDGGATWETVRQLVAGYLEPDGSGEHTLYDYEVPNGVEATYRGRAVHDYSGLFAASAWVEDDATWTSTSWWVKHPHRPDLNMTVRVRSLPEIRRAARRGVFQALGATHAIVVSDTRGPWTGTITFRLDTISDQDALDELLETDAVLLVQGPLNSRDPGYVSFGDEARSRIVDREDGSRVFDTLDFTVVASPAGDVVAWP